MGFAWSCLPICEDGSIVTLKYLAGEVWSGKIINCALRSVGCEDIVKGESFIIFPFVLIEEYNLFLILVDLKYLSII